MELALGVVKEARKREKREKEGPGVSRSQALSRASIPIGAHTAKCGQGDLFLVHLFRTLLCITVVRIREDPLCDSMIRWVFHFNS